MFKKYYLIILVVCFGVFSNVKSQDISSAGYENGTNLNVLYRNDASGKIYAATRGFGAMYRRGKHVNAKTRSYYEIDAQTLRYPKEIKVTGDAADKRRFVYGKINNVLLLRGAVGLQHTFFAKADNKAVEVRYSYSLGPTFAFAKPYYIQVSRTSTTASSLTPRTEESTAVFDDKKFKDDNYNTVATGRASFLDGLSETKVYPGVTAKFNLSFEYAPYTNLIRAIETGVSIDYFPKAVPIMARNSAENFVIALHVGFVFGKKWF